jgi:hypothetical protein
MYQAELHGKLSRSVVEAEDILTSNVFSFYVYSERIHLQRLLAAVRVEVTPEEAQAAIFSFWPTISGDTEPDLVLQVGHYYILVEAKLHSGYGVADEADEKHQLLREARGGRAKAESVGRNFILLTVTDEPAPCEGVYGVLKGQDHESWRWINWSSITHLLETGPPIGRMGDDLLALLGRKGLRRFDGFTDTQDRLAQVQDYLFFDSKTVRFGRFAGFANLLGRSPMMGTSVPGPLFYK